MFASLEGVEASAAPSSLDSSNGEHAANGVPPLGGGPAVLLGGSTVKKCAAASAGPGS